MISTQGKILFLFELFLCENKFMTAPSVKLLLLLYTVVYSFPKTQKGNKCCIQQIKETFVKNKHVSLINCLNKVVSVLLEKKTVSTFF